MSWSWKGNLTHSGLERRPEGLVGACWFFFPALLSTSRSLFASTQPTLGSGCSLTYLVGCLHLAPSHLGWILGGLCHAVLYKSCLEWGTSHYEPSAALWHLSWALASIPKAEGGVLQRCSRAGVTGTELDVHIKVSCTCTGSPKLRKRWLLGFAWSGLQESAAKRVSGSSLSREWGISAAAPAEMVKAGAGGEDRLLTPVRDCRAALLVWAVLRVGVQLFWGEDGSDCSICQSPAWRCFECNGWVVPFSEGGKFGWKKESTAQLWGFRRQTKKKPKTKGQLGMALWGRARPHSPFSGLQHRITDPKVQIASCGAQGGTSPQASP